MAKILAIESSCDETAVAIIDNGSLLANIVSSQVDVHAKYGGVMPEVASRLHCENIGVVIKEALETSKVSLEEIDAFAVTRGPGLIGALHVGLQAAKTLALLYKKPLIPVHHLAGHIYANEYVDEFTFPMLAVVVSGGNTEFVLMKEHLDFEVVASTRDDAIGESYDKVARVLGLPYPGGIPIDRLAKEGKHTYNLPTPLKGEDTLDLSFSGLKPSVIRAVKIVQKYDVKEVILAGGVSANSYLRSEIQEKLKPFNVKINIPPIWCTTDNAAMIAKVAERLYEKKVFANLDLGVDPNWEISDYHNF